MKCCKYDQNFVETVSLKKKVLQRRFLVGDELVEGFEDRVKTLEHQNLAGNVAADADASYVGVTDALERIGKPTTKQNNEYWSSISGFGWDGSP